MANDSQRTARDTVKAGRNRPDRPGGRTITRRHVLVGGAALPATVLAACGRAEDSGTATAGGASPSGGARRIEGVQGRTYELTGPPRRLYVSGGADLNDALALGVVPAVAELFAGVELTAEQRAVDGIEDMAVIEITDGPNFEAIAAADPDFVLMQWADDAYQSRYAQIAPTMFVDSSRPWRDHLRDVAHALFRDAEAELVIGDLELRFEEFRDRFAEREGQVPVVLHVSADAAQLTLMTRESGVGALLEELGFAPIATSGDPYGESVSVETIGTDAPGDFLIVAVDSWRYADPDEPLPEPVAAVLDNPLVTGAPSAPGGPLLLPGDGNALYYLDALTLPRFVDTLDDLLTGQAAR
ncbi:MAG: ABC transporter substrate-binding protein [Kineosporiaceae bacterium]